MQFTPSCENPDPPEISRRLGAVQAGMARQGLDFYLSHDPSNVYYLTNFKNYVHERPFILLVPASGAPTLLCPKLEETHVRSRAVGALVGEVLADNPQANLLACEAIAVATPPAFSHDPHLVPDLSCRLVEGGPHVTLLCGTANGYGAEVERTFFIGHVPEAAVRPFHAMLEARALGFELTVPGADMAEVDRKVNELLKARGYDDNRLHRTGHSFGVTRHEAPFLADGYAREIKPGMLFSIEPGIYLPGIGGFRFSDTVLVTETGNLLLTQAPETLQALTLQVDA